MNIESVEESVNKMSKKVSVDLVRFTLSVLIPTRMHEDLKLHAKLNRIPLSTFVIQILRDYLITHPPEDPFFSFYKNNEKTILQYSNEKRG